MWKLPWICYLSGILFSESVVSWASELNFYSKMHSYFNTSSFLKKIFVKMLRKMVMWEPLKLFNPGRLCLEHFMSPIALIQH